MIIAAVIPTLGMTILALAIAALGLNFDWKLITPLCMVSIIVQTIFLTTLKKIKPNVNI